MKIVSKAILILRSSMMWCVCYCWRLVNPQNLNQVQLLAILYNKEPELLIKLKYLGFLPILIVTAVSYLHLQYSTYLVRSA